MAEATIDKLSIEVSGSAASAAKGFDKLTASLGALEKKLSPNAAKLWTLASNLQMVKSSLKGIDTSGLTQLGSLKVSSTLPKNLAALGAAINSFPASSSARLAGVASAIAPLNGFKFNKASVDNLAMLPRVLREFESLDTGKLTSELERLNTQLAPLAANVQKLSAAYSQMPKSMRSAAVASKSVVAANKNLANSNREVAASSTNVITGFKGIASSAADSLRKISLLSGTLYTLKRMFNATIGEVNTYIENMNLFEASMGKYTKGATDFGQKIQDALGIDFGEWARNQGVFQTLITGMGDTAERAATMSQQLTQLGYDIASFYNISVEDAMLKLQSGMAGELEPLRRLGWDLSNARMQLEATKLGIEGNVQEMTQAEKVGLRYHMIMTQVTQTHGDMARTIESPANQLRVLQAQLTLAARAIGNLFIPALNAILPVVIAVVKAIRLLAQEIANFLGISANFEVDYSSVDYSGMDMGTGQLDDAADAADKATKKVKEYQNTVMGFDELNKLNATPAYDSGSSDSDKGSASPLLDLPLETYDFLEGLKSDITQLTDEMAERIKGLLPYIGAVAAGLAAWKIASGLGADLKTALGLALAIGGAVVYVYNWLDAWNNGLRFDNLLGMFGGLALAVAGVGLAFGPVAAAITGVIGLLGIGVVAFKDMWENGLNWANEIGAAISALGLSGLGAALQGVVAWLESTLGVFRSGLGVALKTVGKLAGALGIVISVIDGIFNAMAIWDAIRNGADISAESVFGLCTSIAGIGLALAPATGGISLIVAAVADAVIAIAALVYNNWDEICDFFSGLPAWFDQHVIQPIVGFFAQVGQVLSGIWSAVVQGIYAWWSGVASWFDANVIQPLLAFWAPIEQWFAQLWGSISATAEAVWYNIGVFADGCWQIVTRVWQVASQWFDQNVVRPITGFFTSLWNGVQQYAQTAWAFVQKTWQVVSGWFSKSVVQPVQGAFNGAWTSITSGAAAAWQRVQQVFSGVASFFSTIFSSAWANVLRMFQYGGQIFNGVVNAVVGAFKWAVNGLIDGINWAVAQPFYGLNSIISAMRGWQILDIYPFAGFREVPVPQIPHLAEGRYGIDAGQLFVARENGAEMVGGMGNHTTVANNQQIVDGIEAGVVRAMLQVLPAFKTEDAGGDVTMVLYVGNEELARATNKGNASMARRGQIKPEFAFV